MDRRRQPPARHQPRARLVAGMSDAVIPIEHSPSATCGLIVVGAAGNINRRLGMMAGTSPRAEQFTCNARLRQRMREASSAGMPDRPSRSQSAWDRDAAARAPGIIVKTTLIKLSPSPSDTTALIQSRLSTRLVVVETPFGQQRPPRGLPAVCRPETLANPAAHRFGRPLLCRHCVRASDSSGWGPSAALWPDSSLLPKEKPMTFGGGLRDQLGAGRRGLTGQVLCNAPAAGSGACFRGDSIVRAARAGWRNATAAVVASTAWP